MPIVADRVKQNVYGYSTDRFLVDTSIAGFMDFTGAFANYVRFYYFAESAAGWEIGIGYRNGTYIYRTNVYKSSNSNNLVGFTGTGLVTLSCVPTTQSMRYPRGDVPNAFDDSRTGFWLGDVCHSALDGDYICLAHADGAAVWRKLWEAIKRPCRLAYTTNDETPAQMVLDEYSWSSGTPGIPAAAVAGYLKSDGVTAFTATVSAHDGTNGVGKAWEVKGAVMASGGVLTLIGTPTITEIAEDAGATAWMLGVTIETVSSATRLTFTVTGAASTTIVWDASVRF